MLSRAAPLRQAASKAARAFSSAPVALPDLSYDYGALEPSISGQIMEIHHSKHHQTYVTNFNATMEKYQDAEAAGDVATMIALQPAIKFNGGGHVNHSIFWTNLSPNGGGAPTGELADLINAEFGSFDQFKTTFNATTAAVQGSGWGWLGYNKAKNSVSVVTTANQDPCSTTGLVPLLGVDVWEHAYYLQYKNVRPDYLNAVWDVVDFANVSERLAAAK
jgi:Fe-Mn family superoxide dismutase